MTSLDIGRCEVYDTAGNLVYVWHGQPAVTLYPNSKFEFAFTWDGGWTNGVGPQSDSKDFSGVLRYFVPE